MKLRDGGPRATGEDRARGTKQNSSENVKLSPLPAEWMDPLSWRLPSGKALAEFALQSGFLAPLLMGGPLGRVKPVKTGAKRVPAEVPVPSGSFREVGFAEVRRRESHGTAGQRA